MLFGMMTMVVKTLADQETLYQLVRENTQDLQNLSTQFSSGVGQLMDAINTQLDMLIGIPEQAYALPIDIQPLVSSDTCIWDDVLILNKCYACVEGEDGVACGMCYSTSINITATECFEDAALDEPVYESSLAWGCDFLFGDHVCLTLHTTLSNTYCFGTRNDQVIRVNPTYVSGDQCVVGYWEPGCTVASIQLFMACQQLTTGPCAVPQCGTGSHGGLTAVSPTPVAPGPAFPPQPHPPSPHDRHA